MARYIPRPKRWHAPKARASSSYDVNRGRSTSPRRGGGDSSTKSTREETEEIRGQIEELNKNLASVSEFVLAEKGRKAEEERLRIEAEAEAERLEAERKACERKEQTRLEKRQRDEQRDAEIDKKLEIQLAIKTGDFFDRMEANLVPVLDFVHKAKPAKKQVHAPDDSEDRSGDNATKEIRTRTRGLTINEKRKRGPEVVVDDSPPITTPAKRSLRRTDAKKKTSTPGRVTRSKAKMKTKLSPYAEKFKKTPGRPSTLEKPRYRNQQMEEPRSLDVLGVQGICKDEQVVYNGEIDAMRFGDVEPIGLPTTIDQLGDESTTLETEDAEQDV
ncbi:hypothetical protein CBR_g24158 [Chara braunii]|uniref:Pinin/SDK/MemA protein domain-containing protein n=1 Tax=Chara braunii TaxID=69332 RepID=A0A388L5X3_CHABU|nr:hypothetical protein CBR_g24158 [Chara braunii]|eukprot:GBG77711.1 hypothetical protein CBR_g24158 [Chara braunii]